MPFGTCKVGTASSLASPGSLCAHQHAWAGHRLQIEGPASVVTPRRRRRHPPPQPPACRRRPLPQKPCCALSGQGGDEPQPHEEQQQQPPLGQGPGSSDDLLRRAEQLREQQRQLEAALQGLPDAQRQAILEALDLSWQQQQQQQQQQKQQAEGPASAVPRQQDDGGTGSGTVPTAGGMPHAGFVGGAEGPAPGSEEWLAGLPPGVAEDMRASGQAGMLQDLAGRLQRDRDWGTSPEFMGGWRCG